MLYDVSATSPSREAIEDLLWWILTWEWDEHARVSVGLGPGVPGSVQPWEFWFYSPEMSERDEVESRIYRHSDIHWVGRGTRLDRTPNRVRDSIMRAISELPFSAKFKTDVVTGWPAEEQAHGTAPQPDVNYRYCKRPVVVEAFHMTRARRFDNSEWPEWLHRAWNHEKGTPGELYLLGRDATENPDRLFAIFTPEGSLEVGPDDWIIRGVAGEIYPCKPDIFEQTYEPADNAAAEGGQEWSEWAGRISAKEAADRYATMLKALRKITNVSGPTGIRVARRIAREALESVRPPAKEGSANDS